MAVRARAAQRTRAPPSPLEAEKRKGEVEEKRRGKQKRNELSSLAAAPSKKAPGTLSPTSWWRARAPAPARLSRQRLLDSRSHAHAHAPGSVHMRSRMHALVRQRRGQPKWCPANWDWVVYSGKRERNRIRSGEKNRRLEFCKKFCILFRYSSKFYICFVLSYMRE